MMITLPSPPERNRLRRRAAINCVLFWLALAGLAYGLVPWPAWLVVTAIAAIYANKRYRRGCAAIDTFTSAIATERRRTGLAHARLTAEDLEEVRI